MSGSSTRRRVSRLLRHVPGAPRAARLAHFERAVRRILTSRIFDGTWYELQAGRRFSSETAAIRDYLRRGRLEALSPAPLFEPSYFDRSYFDKKAGRRARVDPLLRYIVQRDWRTAIGHVLFNPGGYVAEHPEAAQHPGGPLGHFADNARPETLLQIGHVFGRRDVAVPWAHVRERLESSLRTWQEQEKLRRAPRRSETFDRAHAAALRAEASRVALTPRDEPLVSVVMPVWNRSAHLRRAVESVQRQTWGDWELLIVDDGSDDDTPLVLEGIAAFEPRVKVLTQKRQGVSRARNLGIEAARGRYVAFLDSDNVWDPHFLGTAVPLMEARGLTTAYAAMEIHEGDRVSYRAFDGGREYLLVGNHIDLNVLVVRTDVLRKVGGFAEDLRRAVDYDLILRLSALSELTYLPFIGAVYTDDGGDVARISVREPLSWDYAVRSRNAIDWAAADVTERVPGRSSVIVPVRSDVRLARRCVAALLAGDDDIEVLIVDNASHRGACIQLASLGLVDPRVRVHQVPVDLGFALAVNEGLARVTGEYVVVCDPAIVVDEGWLPPLLQALDDDVVAVQSLTVAADDTIDSAGATFTSGGPLPSALLQGHPVDDLAQLGIFEVPALLGRLFLLRTEDAVAARGLDCRLVKSWHATDLSLRLRRDRGGRCLVVPASTARSLPEDPPARRAPVGSDDEVMRERWSDDLPPVDTSLWRRAGFEIAHHESLANQESGATRIQPMVVRQRRTVTKGPAAGLPSLRWALKIAAPSGPRKRLWGDWHFAQSLAEALRRLGQEVVVDAREAVYRPTGYLDDVRLVIRGLDVVRADDGRVNLLWVISHPDEVSREELRGYDAVFAASDLWARRVTADWGVPVEPLLQCTDPHRFHPDVAPPDSGPPVLFVGNSRNVYRPVVRIPVEAGVDVHIYGSGWEQFVPPQVIRGTSLPNAEVARFYRSAGVVLNDHWDDMRSEGFISNRLFDVAAAGGRIVSDHVAGVGALFGGLLKVWRGPEELLELLRAPIDKTFPPDAQRREIAARIAAEHSFDARARRLLKVALERHAVLSSATKGR